MALFEEVYQLIRNIPEGKVTTYGAIARALSTKDARKIGWALHNNPDRTNPCHRVVNKKGGLAPSYAFGGLNEQKNSLLIEGVTFSDDSHVNLKKHLWTPESQK